LTSHPVVTFFFLPQFIWLYPGWFVVGGFHDTCIPFTTPGGMSSFVLVPNSGPPPEGRIRIGREWVCPISPPRVDIPFWAHPQSRLVSWPADTVSSPVVFFSSWRLQPVDPLLPGCGCWVLARFLLKSLLPSQRISPFDRNFFLNYVHFRIGES